MRVSIIETPHVRVECVQAVPLAKGIWYFAININHKHSEYSIVSSMHSLELWICRTEEDRARLRGSPDDPDTPAIVRLMWDKDDGLDGCYTADFDNTYGPSLILIDYDLLQQAHLHHPGGLAWQLVDGRAVEMARKKVSHTHDS